jgi:uncharacterized membrane protein YeaQ/YmgE (transglycosylase-associated protein family)
MYIIFWIIIGGLAGWIAEKVTKSDHGLLTNIIVGIVGAVIGGWLLGLFGVNLEENWIGSLVTAVIGALILLFALKAIRGRR